MPISDIFVFLGCVEAWAILSREITVAMYLGIGIEHAHGLQDHFKINLLLLCSGILCFLTVSGQSANIANADTLGVVPGAMRSSYIDVAPLFNESVGMNNIMIP